MTKKRIIASLWVGVFGALMGVLEGMAGTLEGIDNGRGDYYARFTLPAGAISGFLLCFLLSIVYLRFMTNRSWESGLGWGPLFGASAGAISGFIMAIALTFAGVHDMWWVIPSAVVGVVVGFIMSLVLGPFILVKLTE